MNKLERINVYNPKKRFPIKEIALGLGIGLAISPGLDIALSYIIPQPPEKTNTEYQNKTSIENPSFLNHKYSLK